ncbi:hypothetical protein D3261_03135 [Halococcus sp. IIIV-5B]|nr:hypothetical protein D3261_03135 [Halococcus sp. IIIV-5B]
MKRRVNRYAEAFFERTSPFQQLTLVTILALGVWARLVEFGDWFVTFGFLAAVVIFTIGFTFIRSRADPEHRFEPGRSEATHEYGDVTIHATSIIGYTDDRRKVRRVACEAVDADGNRIGREKSRDFIGEAPSFYGILGGDDEDARSTSDHIVTVANRLHDAIDERRATGGSDPEVSAALEAEFGASTVSQDAEVEEERVGE